MKVMLKMATIGLCLVGTTISPASFAEEPLAGNDGHWELVRSALMGGHEDRSSSGDRDECYGDRIDNYAIAGSGLADTTACYNIQLVYQDREQNKQKTITIPVRLTYTKDGLALIARKRGDMAIHVRDGAVLSDLFGKYTGGEINLSLAAALGGGIFVRGNSVIGNSKVWISNIDNPAAGLGFDFTKTDLRIEALSDKPVKSTVVIDTGPESKPDESTLDLSQVSGNTLE